MSELTDSTTFDIVETYPTGTVAYKALCFEGVFVPDARTAYAVKHSAGIDDVYSEHTHALKALGVEDEGSAVHVIVNGCMCLSGTW